MRIFLINKNHIVSEFVQFAIKNTIHTYEEIDNFECINDKFDLIIIDDIFFDKDKYLQYVNKPCIILSDKHFISNFTELNGQTIIIQKPFLPQKLLEAIESFSNEFNTSILDKNEINKIQQLLNSDDIFNENEYQRSNIENSSVNNRDVIDNISYIFEKNLKAKEKDLTEAILSMKPKKLKKFLKNANITLTIELKDNQCQ